LEADRLKPADWKTIQKQAMPWSDPNFPADISSLIDPKMTKRPNQNAWRSLEWRRPSEIYGDDYKLFDNISSNDVRQGLCGDCYFLSSIASLAEYPKRV